MNLSKALVPFSLAAVAAAAAAQTVPSSVIGQFTTAQEENVHIASLAAIGEARLGNRQASGGDYELDVQDHTKSSFNPNTDLVNKQRNWSSGVYSNFTLSYDKATRAVSFTVGSDTVTSVLANNEAFTDLFIRTYAQGQRGISAGLKNLALTTDFGSGTQTRTLLVSQHSQATSANEGSAVWIHGGSLSNLKNWSVTGQLAFGFTNPSQATGSRGGIQFKIGTAVAQPVPEPATMGVLALGALGLIRRKRSA